VGSITSLLDKAAIEWVKKPRGIRIVAADKQMILDHAELFRVIAQSVRSDWDK
jgi:hypothetical protein